MDVQYQRFKPRLHVSVNLLAEYGRHVARLCRRRTNASTSKTALHDNPEKINLWVFFSFLYGYGAPRAWQLFRAAGEPPKNICFQIVTLCLNLKYLGYSCVKYIIQAKDCKEISRLKNK